MARRLGVREATVTNCEKGRERPRIRHHAAILWFLGYDPEPASETLPGRLLAIRRRLGLTQAELASRLGQDEQQICRWERGLRTPHPAIAGRIDRALRALEGRAEEDGSEPPGYFDQTRWRRKPPVGGALRPKSLGERLRARRLELGLSATLVARRLEVSRGTLWRIEQGRQVAVAWLECRLRELLDFDDAR